MAHLNPNVKPPDAGVLKMRELIGQHGGGGWEESWKQGITPWDSGSGQPRPPLKELVEEVKFEIPRTGRALVPGCGRGYDAAYFARLGLDTWGIDIATTAVEAAKAFVAAMPDPPPNVQFKALDFFNFELPEADSRGSRKFALAYDYTFLCALPPSVREAWGQRYADIIEPGGVLIALVFPIEGDRTTGPPFSLSPEIYEPLLGENFERVYLEKPLRPAEGREGREMMSVWRRKATT